MIVHSRINHYPWQKQHDLLLYGNVCVSVYEYVSVCVWVCKCVCALESDARVTSIGI